MIKLRNAKVDLTKSNINILATQLGLLSNDINYLWYYLQVIDIML